MRGNEIISENFCRKEEVAGGEREGLFFLYKNKLYKCELSTLIHFHNFPFLLLKTENSQNYFPYYFSFEFRRYGLEHRLRNVRRRIKNLMKEPKEKY